MAEVSRCDVPVILAGGDLTGERDALLATVRAALEAGAAGVAHGRNVWGSDDPAAAVAALRVWSTRERRRVAERVALVTGASRGMGRAIALALARGGARVMAVARDAGALAALHAEQPRIQALAADLDTPDGCAQAIEATRSRLGPIAILVNNAGRGGWHDRPIWEQDRAGWAASLAINLDAPFELTRLAVPDMLAARWGRIVMISSTAGQVGATSLGPYCASKHGVIGLMRSVAHDVAPFGVTCNAVLPGWVRTEMAERDAERKARELGVDVEDGLGRAGGGVPVGPDRRGGRDRRASSASWPATRRARSTARRSPSRSGVTGDARGPRRRPQRGGASAAADSRQRGVPVQLLRQDVERDLVTCLFEPPRVGHSLVAQRIDAGDADVCRRGTRDVVGEQRRDARVLRRRRVAEVVRAEPAHLRGGQPRPVLEDGVARVLAGDVG